MDMSNFFYSSPNELSYMLMSESSRAHFNRRPRVVELLVPMCCTKCQEKIRESMQHLEGVTGVIVNPTTQRVTVTGFVDPLRTLKRARKVKKHSQLLSGEEATSSKQIRRPSGYQTGQTSFNRYTPNPYAHRQTYEDLDRREITNPCYAKRVEGVERRF